jgi:hypothetical protein
MLSADNYRAYADTAFESAQQYRDNAENEPEPRRSRLLKWADIREDDAEFYLSRASLIEEYEDRHARQEAAE